MDNSMIKDTLLNRAIELTKQIDEMKKAYSELDKITEALHDLGFESEKIGGVTVLIRDNFADKNVVFRPAGVRRFELKIEKN